MRQVKATANCECRAAGGSLCLGQGMPQEQDSAPGFRPDEVHEVPAQLGQAAACLGYVIYSSCLRTTGKVLISW